MLRILTTAYNCEEFVSKCLNSMSCQTEKRFCCYFFDDLCTDRTENIFHDLVGKDDRFIYIKNKTKRYQTGNYDYLIRGGDFLIDDEDIMVNIDADDWLPDRNVFKRVLSYYDDGKTWVTHGNKIWLDRKGPQDMADWDLNPPIKELRKKRFSAVHLRTWKAFLWRSIKPEDLKLPDGKFPIIAGDLFFMWPMLEMAGEEHHKHTKDINYIYNTSRSYRDEDILAIVAATDMIARQKEPYKPLTQSWLGLTI